MAEKAKSDMAAQMAQMWSGSPMQPWVDAWLEMWPNASALKSNAPAGASPLDAMTMWTEFFSSLAPGAVPKPTLGKAASSRPEAPQSLFPDGLFPESLFPMSGAMDFSDTASAFWPMASWSFTGGRDPETPIETWLSFSPMAPVFGIRWAFAPAQAAFAEEQSTRKAEATIVHSAVTERERAALNRKVASAPVGGAAAPSPAADAPQPKRQPRLRVVDGGAQEPATEAPKKAPTPKPAATEDAASSEASKLKRAGVSARAAARKAAATPVRPDDLTAIKGVGAKLAALLNDLGVSRFQELAEMSTADFEKLDEKLGSFRGRWRRDDWQGQAAELAKSAR